MIGNAVPPALALAIASRLREDLGNEKTAQKEGALLTFVPTMADGCSPALKYVTDRINSRFEQYVQSQELLLWR